MENVLCDTRAMNEARSAYNCHAQRRDSGSAALASWSLYTRSERRLLLPRASIYSNTSIPALSPRMTSASLPAEKTRTLGSMPLATTTDVRPQAAPAHLLKMHD